jgi:hypothetical protein
MPIAPKYNTCAMILYLALELEGREGKKSKTKEAE